MSQLDPEEQDILDVFERGELKRAANVTQEIELHKEIAEATFRQDVHLDIRLSSRDLRSLQVRALQEGIPYQSLASSILHKFVDGQLVEKATR
jgi:predicted DNA binding CopG/RHH family protein